MSHIVDFDLHIHIQYISLILKLNQNVIINDYREFSCDVATAAPPGYVAGISA